MKSAVRLIMLSAACEYKLAYKEEHYSRYILILTNPEAFGIFCPTRSFVLC